MQVTVSFQVVAFVLRDERRRYRRRAASLGLRKARLGQLAVATHLDEAAEEAEDAEAGTGAGTLREVHGADRVGKVGERWELTLEYVGRGPLDVGNAFACAPVGKAAQ